MKILWLTNIPLPEASILMGENPVPFGGWLVGMSSLLAENDDIKLSVAFPKQKFKNVRMLKGKKINYYIFPEINEKNIYSYKTKNNLQKIIEDVNPDIVHIFGTEFPHTLAMIEVCNEKNIKTVISIQGLVSIIYQHYLSGIPTKVKKQVTFRDLIKKDNLIQQQQKFYKRGQIEIKALKKAKYVIGRTTWDKACISQINPDAKYYFCNEILRDEFYKHTWDINKCEKHSIFLSQGQYPIKGLHFMLEALPLILREFPNAKLYVGGHNIVKDNTLADKLKISSYGKYIKELIRKHKLQGKVIFTGLLNEKEMCQRYLGSHVFVCPSSIENSPNSLGEAMILGVPCVASYVGGIPDMMEHRKEGFIYQTDAPYMLAYHICQIFNDEELALKFSKKARERAIKTHNRDNIIINLTNIYKSIIFK